MHALVDTFLRWIAHTWIGEIYWSLFGRWAPVATVATLALPSVVHWMRTGQVPIDPTREWPPRFTRDGRGFLLPLAIAGVGCIVYAGAGSGWAELIAALSIALLVIRRKSVKWDGFWVGFRVVVLMAAVLMVPVWMWARFRLSVVQTVICLWLIAAAMTVVLFSRQIRRLAIRRPRRPKVARASAGG